MRASRGRLVSKGSYSRVAVTALKTVYSKFRSKHKSQVFLSNFLRHGWPGTDVHMTTEATLECTCVGVCGGYFRLLGYRGAATERLPFDAGASTIQARRDMLL